jgi:hypothetical protein
MYGRFDRGYNQPKRRYNEMKTKITEVTQHEFERLLFEEEREASKKVSDSRWFLSDSLTPCIYKRGWYKSAVTCPITEKDYQKRDLPLTFKNHRKEGVIFLQHAADTMCHHLSMSVTVRCYARVRNGERTVYQICEHKVGRCPHKE